MMRIDTCLHGEPKERVASSYVSKKKKDFQEQVMLELYFQRWIEIFLASVKKKGKGEEDQSSPKEKCQM